MSTHTHGWNERWKVKRDESVHFWLECACGEIKEPTEEPNPLVSTVYDSI